MNGPPSALTLDRACALMAAAFTGSDDTDETVRRLDVLAETVGPPSFEGVLEALRHRFTGNRLDYHDPRNSYLPEVLRRGLGLPITLSVVAIEVGRRLGVHIDGVGLPGHFIVGDGTGERFADPFNGAALHDRTSLRAAWPILVGSAYRFDDLHLVAVSERAILIRMLNNLRGTVLGRRDLRALQALTSLRSAFAELALEATDYPAWFRHYN